MNKYITNMYQPLLAKNARREGNPAKDKTEWREKNDSVRLMQTDD